MQRATVTQKIHHALLRRAWNAGPRTRHFEFEMMNGRHFEFQPGQFISLHIKLQGQRLARAYSIASRIDNRFELVLNVGPEELVSPWLLGLKGGDAIEFTGPYGAFQLHHPLTRISAFIATGTGIAPIRAMLQELYHQDRPDEAWLIFGVRKEADILYREEFEKLAKRYPGFHFIPTLSRPDAGWSGHAGYVQQQIKKYLSGKQGLHAYICGSPRMVQEVRGLLRTLGYGPEAVSYEKLE